MTSGDRTLPEPRSGPASGSGMIDLRGVDLDVVRTGVRLLALRRLGDLNLADDVAQETVVRTLAALEEGRLEDPDRFGAFARGVALHIIADHLRERSGGRLVPLRSVAPSHEPDPLGMIISGEERDRVRAALRELSNEDRELIHLCFFEGVSPGELARRLGEPGPRIRKRKSRALARLRRAFLGEDPEAARSRTDPSADMRVGDGDGPATRQEDP